MSPWLGQVWAASIASTEGPGARLLQSWDLTSVDLRWCPCENVTSGTPGPVASTPVVEAGQMAVPTVYSVSPHKRMTGDTTERTPRQTALAEEYSVALLPVGVLQSHLPRTTAQTCNSETDLGASTPTTREQTQSLTGL